MVFPDHRFSPWSFLPSSALHCQARAQQTRARPWRSGSGTARLRIQSHPPAGTAPPRRLRGAAHGLLASVVLGLLAVALAVDCDAAWEGMAEPPAIMRAGGHQGQ
ncbi:hypothetical protein C8J57DRAFT_1547272 [Mycena rebaudengoi]|nr:hypothetical protein C8J57DRAFT_1547272 [Mycena rebaudengoi]